MSKLLTREELNKVLEEYWWFQKNSNQAAKAAGISQQTASGIIKTFIMMRDGNIDGLVEEAATNQKISVQTVKLVAERIGMDAPEEVIQAILERTRTKVKRAREKQAGQAAAPAEEMVEPNPLPEQKSPAPPAQAEVKAGNDALYFIRILEELHEQNQLLRDLLDVVIPHHIQDMKDNMNANFDALAQQVKEHGQALDAIRCNTRKRGL